MQGKGIDDYIYLARKMAGLDFKWIGNDETSGWLKKQDIPSNIEFENKPLTKEEVLSEMEISKFFLHPSLHEGIPNVCIEANSAKCLIIHNAKST